MDPRADTETSHDTLPHLRPKRPLVCSGALLDVVVDGATDRGRVRQSNEDQFLVAEMSRSLTLRACGVPGFEPHRVSGAQGVLLAVADGLGGHGRGELASAVALDALTHYMVHVLPWFWQEDVERSDQLLAALELALERCQDQIFGVAARKGVGHLAPGTTLTMGYITGAALYLVHAGDSRAYLLRGGELRRLTRDHTLAQQIADAEGVAVEEVRVPHFHHVLSNAVGAGERALRADVGRIELARGDALLFCSDGLTRHLDDRELAAALATDRSPRAIARELIETANERGGEDNITAVIARL